MRIQKEFARDPCRQAYQKRWVLERGLVASYQILLQLGVFELQLLNLVDGKTALAFTPSIYGGARNEPL
ncbi:hypothetical protein D3C84_951730 [compost metagenome]